MTFIDPMSSLLISDTPIKLQAGVDACTGDMRIATDDGRLAEGDRDEPGQYLRKDPYRRWLTSAYRREQELFESTIWIAFLDNYHKYLRNQRIPALERILETVVPEENYSVHCSVRAPKPSVRLMPWTARMERVIDIASALMFLHSSLGPYSIGHADMKPENILLDEKVERKLSCFGLSRQLHADDYTHIPIGRAVPTHNGRLDAKFSGKPSAKRSIETSIGSQMTRRPRYLRVHHHPLMQMSRSACKWSGDMFTSCERLITSKRTLGDVFKGWVSEMPKYETPKPGPVFEYVIRKFLGNRNGLTVNESQQHSDLDSCRSGYGKIAVNTKTSASWIVATGAPHHATGNRNLLSGFTMEHDDQFVHAVNRVPMKVLARVAVVTDTLILPDVWFVPGLTENLVSVSQLAELDHSIGFGHGECCIRSACDAKIVGKGRLQKGGHYELDFLKVPLAI